LITKFYLYLGNSRLLAVYKHYNPLSRRCLLVVAAIGFQLVLKMRFLQVWREYIEELF